LYKIIVSGQQVIQVILMLQPELMLNCNC